MTDGIFIRPYPRQEQMLSSPADIGIFGGSGGGGKTWAMLLEPLRHVNNSQFGAVILRRTTVQVRTEGGLWDTSNRIYPYCHAKGFSHSLEWRFPSGMTVSMAGLEYEKDIRNYQGSQIPLICWDELTHFSAKMFWEMLARNRSVSGVSGYVRCSCNPDPDSFVRQLIAWWIDDDTGLAIPERSGKIRYFHRYRDELHWADTKEELINKFGVDCEPKSLTFIRSSIFDNPALLEADPGYLASLKALPEVQMQQLLFGNWNVRPAAGLYFTRSQVEMIDAPPVNVADRVRYWDRAGSKRRQEAADDGKQAATAGVKMSIDEIGTLYIEHVERLWDTPHNVNAAIINMASQDGKRVRIGYMQDPGSAGLYEAQDTARKLNGYEVSFSTASGSKIERFVPFSSQVKAGNVKVVRGQWNEAYFRELENFPPPKESQIKQMDMVDGTSGAHEMICNRPRKIVIGGMPGMLSNEREEELR